MIRFIDIGRQMWLDENDQTNTRQFCFFNTIPDRFLEFMGEQVFDNWDDFEQAVREQAGTIKGDCLGYIERCRGLCPPWVFTGDPPQEKS